MLITGTTSAGRIHTLPIYSDRQSAYAERLKSTVYTPQMIVDGSTEFVGSDATLAQKAIVKALGIPKTGVSLSSVSLEPSGVLRAHVETGALDSRGREAEVYVVIALSHAESSVSGGENSGRRLTHVGVVRKIERVGSIQRGHSFAQDVHVKLDAGADPNNLRLIAFVQESHQGRVLGAASQVLGMK